MTETEKLRLVKIMTGEKDDDVVSTYLAIAEHKVLERLYPFGGASSSVPTRYAHTQVEVACFLLNKRGAEGQVSHSENGIQRSYEDGDVPPSLLRGIVPCASVISSKEVAADESTGA